MRQYRVNSVVIQILTDLLCSGREDFYYERWEFGEATTEDAYLRLYRYTSQPPVATFRLAYNHIIEMNGEHRLADVAMGMVRARYAAENQEE